MNGRPMNHDQTLAQIGATTLGAVGARRFVTDDDSLSFTITRGHRRVRIWLSPADEYEVTTTTIRGGRETFRREGVYCEELAEVVYDAHVER